MAKISKFEDLIAWQKARTLAKTVYQITKAGSFAKDFGLAGQIQRASVSVMSNLAEGFERSRLGEFHQYLSMAKASCGEVRSQLYVALDVGYIQRADFEKIMSMAEETSKVIGGLRAAIGAAKVRHTQDSALRTQD
ncbi:MAG: four helix bundle protein [Candidatus Omnitrophica bacterium]|nr:four helix bundle protein [Candidatus Omnitrophota bacterium]